METVQKEKTDLYKIGHRIIRKSEVKNLRGRGGSGKKGQHEDKARLGGVSEKRKERCVVPQP